MNRFELAQEMDTALEKVEELKSRVSNFKQFH